MPVRLRIVAITSLLLLCGADKPATQPTTNPAGPQVRSTIEVERVGEEWYVIYSVVNLSNETITVPNRLRMVHVEPEPTLTAEGLIGPTSYLIGRMYPLKEITLKPREGFIRPLSLFNREFKPGKYVVSVTVDQAYERFKPKPIMLVVP